MNSKDITLNVMAPLVVGNPHDIESPDSQSAWSHFREQLRQIKALGIESVTTDVWWGLIEPKEGQFDWTYYDKLSKTIIDEGLKWVPILSFHRCGGNVGDTVTVHLPRWVWKKVKLLTGANSIEDVQYVSEQGNASDEFISAWATEAALPLYENVMVAFQAHFAHLAESIAEVNVSLGPAGELRYPSYNNHDTGADYPSRGAMQCYSALAIASFASWALSKYGGYEGLDAAWGTNTVDGQEILPPSNVEEFFRRFDHHDTQYGYDIIDWYSDSLFEHGRKIMLAALEIFDDKDAAFRGIDIGAKVPGVHWQTGKNLDGEIKVGPRLPELTAGLIRTSTRDWDPAQGFGYKTLIELLANLNKIAAIRKNLDFTITTDHCGTVVDESGPTSRFVLHYTCLEMPDGEDGSRGNSVAQSLVTFVGREAVKQGVPVKGENALWWNLPKRNAWRRMRSHLRAGDNPGSYDGLTILRMSNILENDVAHEQMRRTVEYARHHRQGIETPATVVTG